MVFYDVRNANILRILLFLTVFGFDELEGTSHLWWFNMYRLVLQAVRDANIWILLQY